MEDTQYDQFHVIDGIPEFSFRTKTGFGADYLKADSFLQDHPDADVYIVGNDNNWFIRKKRPEGNMWTMVSEPKFLAMYRLVNH
jgi:hypothetical protein